VQALGAGIALDGPDGIADAVRTLLAEPSYAARALGVAAETRQLPPVAEAVLAIREYADA
jgi:UDP:flavonoid glycosyltransferase YjiC (YdhE family)